jgi:iron(III) transport system substrate-binding protein
MISRDRLPKNYTDLLNPTWNGKIMMEGTKADWFAGMLQIMGRQEGLQYMRNLAKQNIMLRTGHSLIAQLVAAGEAVLDVNITLSSANRLKEKGAPIDWLALGPIPGIMIGIGTVTNPAHPNAAKLFVDFILSQEGQKVVEKFDRVSARSDMSGEQERKYKHLKLVPVNPALGENLNEYAELLRQIFAN